MDAPPIPTRRWWKTPPAFALGAITLICSLGILFEDKIVPPPKETGPKIVLPGGGTFCDPLPVQPSAPSHSVPALKDH